MLTYTDVLDTVTASDLHGFFVGWPDPPSPSAHLRLLQRSTHVILAREESGAVVGYVTALSDGVLFAFISSLEVLPSYQGKGIGSELMNRIILLIGDLYAIDAVCDLDIQPFYARMGMRSVGAMCLRRYEYQNGRDAGTTAEN